MGKNFSIVSDLLQWVTQFLRNRSPPIRQIDEQIG